jgi:hypothetical protein
MKKYLIIQHIEEFGAGDMSVNTFEVEASNAARALRKFLSENLRTLLHIEPDEMEEELTEAVDDTVSSMEKGSDKCWFAYAEEGRYYVIQL